MPMDELGVALYNIMLQLDDRILLRYSSIRATKLQMS